MFEIMKENDIDLNWLFVLASLKGREGLLFFKANISTDDDDNEIQVLEPQCILIDGAKVIYKEDSQEDYIIDAKNGICSLNRIDGLELKINLNEINDFAFKFKEFDKTRKSNEPNDGFIKVD